MQVLFAVPFIIVVITVLITIGFNRNGVCYEKNILKFRPGHVFLLKHRKDDIPHILNLDLLIMQKVVEIQTGDFWTTSELVWYYHKVTPYPKLGQLHVFNVL